MSNFDGLSKTQKIRAALHRDVRSVCSETCHFLGLEITKPAMEIIAELLYKKLSVYGSDLEAFAKHAKRATINSEDVKLLVRRNPSLKAHLSAIGPTSSSVTKDKRRKTVALPTVPAPTLRPETPKSNENETVTRLVEKTLSISKDDVKDDPKKDEFEEMIIDNTIDLTFD